METNQLPLRIEQLSINHVADPQINETTKSLSNYKQLPTHDLTSALLNRLFPEQNQEEKIVRQTRALLGNLVERYTTEQLEEIIIQILYLSETWLDAYERKIFDGKTLNELLNMG